MEKQHVHQIMVVGQYFLKLSIISSLVLMLLLMMKTIHAHDISNSANYTFIESAVAKGAVCLDGSPPAYALMEGYEQGSNNWIVFLEGGGWCDTSELCLHRSNWTIGSSAKRRNTALSISNGGYLSGNQSYNPEFYNWNRANLAYCDGASYMGDVEEPDPKTGVYYRGKRVFDAVMEELLEKGLKNADNAILAGVSAGGLAATLHCDGFRSLLPNVKRVKCISDSGFFIRAQNLPGADNRAKLFDRIVKLHGIAKNLPKSCTSRMSPELCFFPENFLGHIQTPIFLIESSFDAWQIKVNLLPSFAERDEWEACTNPKFYFRFCNEDQLHLIREFRRTFIKTLRKLEYSPSRGVYVHTRYTHMNGFRNRGWRCSATDNNILANKTIARAVADWFFDRSPFQVIDTKKYALPRVECGDHNDEDFRYLFDKKCFSTTLY